MKPATRAIHAGQSPDSHFGAVVNPIWQSSTFTWKNLDEKPAHDYSRDSNPNRETLERVIASLEGGNYCRCFSSGMAAIVAAFSLLKAGDHVLMATDIYGGTFAFGERFLPKQGVEVGFFNSGEPGSIRGSASPNTKLLIFETPSNPALRVADIRAIATEARNLGILTVFDNTFASPMLQQPLELGVDIVVHSTTKYISGHSDIIGGCLVTNDSLIAEQINEYATTAGAAPSPFDCWLALRGVKTLALRINQHCKNALGVAKFLNAYPKVSAVHYPGLESHPDHAIAAAQMLGGFGGMLAFELEGGEHAVKAVAENTKIFTLAESLGGVESLIAYPPLMSHKTMNEQQRLERGVTPDLLRLSVGIEDLDDLLQDLEQALAKS